MATNVRKLLAELLAVDLPAGWVVIDHGTDLDNPMKPTIVVRQTTMTRTPGQPRMYRDLGFTVGLVEPGLDPQKLEDALDADVAILIDVLEKIPMPGLTWQDALRVTFDSKLAGYDIHLTITTEKD